MCFAKIGPMVALYQAYLQNVGQRFIVGIQGVCVHSFEAIGPVVPEISCSQTNCNTDSSQQARSGPRRHQDVTDQSVTS